MLSAQDALGSDGFCSFELKTEAGASAMHNEWKDNTGDQFLDRIPDEDETQEPQYDLGHGRKIKAKYLQWLESSDTPMMFSKNFMYVQYKNDEEISRRTRTGRNNRNSSAGEAPPGWIVTRAEENGIMERALKWFLRRKKPDITEKTLGREMKKLGHCLTERINQSNKDYMNNRKKDIDQNMMIDKRGQRTRSRKIKKEK